MSDSAGPPLPAWVKVLISINTGLLLAAMTTGASIAWRNETRLALVESDVRALKSGKLIKMADETRARFNDLETRIAGIIHRQAELSDDMDAVREGVIVLREGLSELRARLPSRRSESKPKERDPLPAFVPAPPDVGG